MSAYQRVQLQSLLQVADRIIVTTEAYGRAICRPAIHVPVGSNITPLGLTRERARERLRLGDELVVTLFGTGHPSRALHHVRSAIAMLATQRGSKGLKVFNLGLGSPRLRLSPEIDVLTPGRLEPNDISVRLHASDVLLLPFADGVSSRRTTLMAGLAHGVPVVGLYGRNTDRVFLERTEALRLTPFEDAQVFADVVARLCADQHALRALGEAGRRLYHAEFDWPVAARRVRAALADQRDGA
jgi:glycosyltransferase involved in cell wall biosynthesis